MIKKTWIVVANGSTARLLQVENNRSLTEIRQCEHPESRMYGKDLVSDRPGRSFESASVTRHALQEKVSHKELEKTAFAQELASLLNTAREKREFERLLLAVSPAFLGELRQFLSDRTNESIAEVIDKDLTHCKLENIKQSFQIFQ